MIHFRGTKTDASDADVPLLPELAAELKAHRLRQAALDFDRIAGSALVFQTDTVSRQWRRSALRALNTAAKNVGLTPKGTQPLGNHDLRHSAAAWAISNPEMSMTEVARFLRHPNTHVTEVMYSGQAQASIAGLGAKLARGAR